MLPAASIRFLYLQPTGIIVCLLEAMTNYIHLYDSSQISYKDCQWLKTPGWKLRSHCPWRRFSAERCGLCPWPFCYANRIRAWCILEQTGRPQVDCAVCVQIWTSCNEVTDCWRFRWSMPGFPSTSLGFFSEGIPRCYQTDVRNMIPPAPGSSSGSPPKGMCLE